MSCCSWLSESFAGIVSDKESNEQTKQAVVKQPGAKSSNKKHNPFSGAKKSVMVCALYDYTPSRENELAFKRDDILKVIDLFDQPWQMAENTRTHEIGLIPFNYVTENTMMAGALGAYFEVNRVECEKRLLAPGTEIGCYMIRPSRKKDVYALSVRTMVDGHVKIRHFQIYQTDRGFYIDAQYPFNNMNELIFFYRENPLVDACILTIPCEREKPHAPFQEAELDRSVIKMTRLIDRGNFGEVWLGRIQSVEVAIKKPLCTAVKEDFLREAKKMHAIWHPQLVQFLGVCTKPESEPILIVTEFMSKGSLSHFLPSEEGRKLMLIDKLLILDQAANGMCYLESIALVHRDLRAANVFVADNLRIKVGDFGQSKMLLAPGNTPLDIKTPVRWSSPEALTNEAEVDSASDVWQFGILSYEVFTYGERPYNQYNDKGEVARAIVRGEMLNQPKGCPSPYYAIMQSCWQMNKLKRPSFRELKSNLESLIESIDSNYVPDWANGFY